MITFTRIDPAREVEDLVSFMTSNAWPFHVNSTPHRTHIEDAVSAGAYRDEDNDSYWIDHEHLGRIGFFRLEDLSDDTPVFDMRIAEKFRGKGLGAEVLTAATGWVFGKFPQIERFEGQTRDDNLAMRKVFLRCGWVKEAHYRRGWPVDGGEPRASVAYAILRTDWENGTITPVPWDDDLDGCTLNL